jgi:hypothetical protein
MRVFLIALLTVGLNAFAEVQPDHVDDTFSFNFKSESSENKKSERNVAAKVEDVKKEDKKKDDVKVEKVEERELPFWNFKKEKF